MATGVGGQQTDVNQEVGPRAKKYVGDHRNKGFTLIQRGQGRDGASTHQLAQDLIEFVIHDVRIDLAGMPSVACVKPREENPW